LRLIRDEIQELEEYIADLRRMHGYYEEEGKLSLVLINISRRNQEHKEEGH